MAKRELKALQMDHVDKGVTGRLRPRSLTQAQEVMEHTCECGRSFAKPHGLAVHQGSCRRMAAASGSGQSMSPVSNAGVPNHTHSADPPLPVPGRELPREDEFLLKPKLKLPPAGDKKRFQVWDKEFDEDFRLRCQVDLDHDPIDKVVEAISSFAYWHASEKFGVHEKNVAKPKRKVQSRIIKVRALKKRARRKWQQMKANPSTNADDFAKQKRLYRGLIRLHNRILKQEEKAENAYGAEAERARFDANPWRYAKSLFSDAKGGKPSFDKNTATDFFTKTYSDADRAKPYEPLEDMKEPAPPEMPFGVEEPTVEEFVRALRRKRNGSAPGSDGLPYLLYKNCPRLRSLLFRVIRRVWRERSIPRLWQLASIILLAKSEKVEDPAEFRPIALGNVGGKLIFTLVQRRLMAHMLGNKYLDRCLQKGFIPGVAGCTEHGELLFRALRDAKASHRGICVTWVDLRNAFGSVRHSLIRFALKWYKVPEEIVTLIMNYYDGLAARVVADDWQTPWFAYEIGVFQGCTMSTILFNMVFNLLCEMYQGQQTGGYNFKSANISVRELLFADDLSLVTRIPKENQQLLNVLDKFLAWSVTMAAKPTKCKTLALHFQNPGVKKMRYQPLPGWGQGQYVPFDPELVIAGAPIAPIDKKVGCERMFKFLGRLISMTLKETEQEKATLRS